MKGHSTEEPPSEHRSHAPCHMCSFKSKVISFHSLAETLSMLYDSSKMKEVKVLP